MALGPMNGKGIKKSGHRSAPEGYAITALVLQGGGALGSYQAGVYQGLAEAGIHPNWVAGISIGSLNAAVIAGNPPEKRVERLRAFWEHICRQPWWPPLPHARFARPGFPWPDSWRGWINTLEASRAFLEGQNGFFVPRPWTSLAWAQADPHTASFYDTRPLKATLERFADFDRVNRADEMRVSIGVVNVESGNFRYFDNLQDRLRPEHFMASGALPPGFPAIEIDGEYYWDGGLVSNTPLLQVLNDRPRRDALIFQIDLWSATGPLPTDLQQVATRKKDIQYSSRTRFVTAYMQDQQQFRSILNKVLALVPQSERSHPAYRQAREAACDARRNVIHLIYRNKAFEGHTKDAEFSLLTLNDHWESGLDDARNTLAHPEWLLRPSADHPFVTHDVHRLDGAVNAAPLTQKPDAAVSFPGPGNFERRLTTQSAGSIRNKEFSR